MKISTLDLPKSLLRDVSEFEPAGPQVMLKVPKIRVAVDETLEKGRKVGLVFTESTERGYDEEKRRLEYGADTGEVYKVGFLAWKDYGNGTPWAAKGDQVIFRKYAGTVPEHQDEEGDFYIRVVNDNEIYCVKEARQ